MKRPFYKILSPIIITIFLLYWVGIFILMLPSNYAGTTMSLHAPAFRNMFNVSWKLFTPPRTYNYRLYFIVKQIGEEEKHDTLEVLENIALKKQQHAPFNQRENLVDHIINNNVLDIIKNAWASRKMPSDTLPESVNILYVKQAMKEVANLQNCKAQLATLNSYRNTILKENNIDTTAKEVKIIICKKMTRPFNQITGTGFFSSEILVFETPYKPVSQ